MLFTSAILGKQDTRSDSMVLIKYMQSVSRSFEIDKGNGLFVDFYIYVCVCVLEQ